ncbi:hypothetical protein [Gilliamella sp. N-G2]|uniref:hypothetical protein n=1 Tax=Gilliamella sp. N-G2 TaxID=1970471 RepID=UPI000A33921B|nr:hypothetical protein [Gilliamella sp. N-G2]OTQ71873.1 hypothetical protein B6C99_11735 [Gilliamella sp. N-G2]
MKSDMKQNLLTSAMTFAHSRFEKFVISNKLDFSLVRSPKLKAINDYKENDTAQIFDVFLQGFRAAVEFQLIDRNNNEGK